MINRILGTIAVASIATPAAFAGVYVNVEANSALTGTDYSSTTTDFHVGYEDSTDSFNSGLGSSGDVIVFAGGFTDLADKNQIIINNNE